MYLGIDLGTSGVKCLLMNEEGKVVASHTEALAVSMPREDWCEQNPKDWLEATQASVDSLHAQHPKELSALRAIGLSGQMHGATLLDARGEVLRACLLWNDTRASQPAARLDALPMFREITGNIVFPGFTAPKVLWVKENEPDVYGQLAKIVLPKDYLRLWLSGNYASDMSDASGTAWLDVGRRDWSDLLLSACELDRSFMPDLFEGTQVTGTLRQELRNRWGVKQEVKIAAGAGDNAATACGLGVLRQGDAFLSLGTSGVIFAAANSFAPCAQTAMHTFAHAVPATWHRMSVMLSAASCMEWWCGLTGSSHHELLGEDEELHPAAAPFFYPYLTGERTPWNDAHLRATFTLMHATHDRQRLTHAVFMGVAFALRDNFAALNTFEKKIMGLQVAGGGSRSPLWLKYIASVLKVPLYLPTGADMNAALGAARLAQLAATGEAAESVCRPPASTTVIEPVVEHIAALESNYQQWHEGMSHIQALSTAASKQSIN